MIGHTLTRTLHILHKQERVTPITVIIVKSQDTPWNDASRSMDILTLINMFPTKGLLQPSQPRMNTKWMLTTPALLLHIITLFSCS